MTRMCLNIIHFTSFILCIHLSRISRSSHYCLFFTYAIFCPVQIAVLITNGQSDDQVSAAVRAVADNGITIFAVGECGSCYCEFFQHPHCSSPSDFIQALPAYLQCLQLEIHVLCIWIHWIQCGYLCVGVLFLSTWARSCFCMYTHQVYLHIQYLALFPLLTGISTQAHNLLLTACSDAIITAH